MKLLITDILVVATRRKSEMTSYLNNGYDVMKYLAKFEKFLPHRIIVPSFMTVGKSNARVREGGGVGLFCPYKLGSQNTSYKLGLTTFFHWRQISY